MGGLYPKMKVTALTMLMGVLAIAGTPFFSGWYSKDMILAQAMGYGVENQRHFLLFLLPLVTAGITTFYMFRMWLMTFAGRPRDEHVFEHAHESPWIMLIPLIVLAFFSVVVAWGLPPWQAEESLIGGGEGVLQASEQHPIEPSLLAEDHRVHEASHHYHMVVEGLAFLAGAIGVVFAFAFYYFRLLDPAQARNQFPGVYRLLQRKWYFDELYSALLVRPALVVAGWCRAFDTRGIDGVVDNTGRLTVAFSRGEGRFDLGIVDGLVNLTARVVYAVGARLRRVQTGYVRSYVLFLVLAVVGIFAVLSYLMARASAGPPP